MGCDATAGGGAGAADPCPNCQLQDAVACVPAGCMNPTLPFTRGVLDPCATSGSPGFGRNTSTTGNAHSNASAAIVAGLLRLPVDGKLLITVDRARRPRLRVPCLDKHPFIGSANEHREWRAQILSAGRPFRHQGLAALRVLKRTTACHAPTRRIHAKRAADRRRTAADGPGMRLLIAIALTADVDLAAGPSAPRSRRSRLLSGGQRSQSDQHGQNQSEFREFELGHHFLFAQDPEILALPTLQEEDLYLIMRKRRQEFVRGKRKRRVLPKYRALGFGSALLRPQRLSRINRCRVPRRNDARDASGPHQRSNGAQDEHRMDAGDLVQLRLDEANAQQCRR